MPILTGILLPVAVGLLNMNDPGAGELWLFMSFAGIAVAAGALALFAAFGSLGQLLAMLAACSEPANPAGVMSSSGLQLNVAVPSGPLPRCRAAPRLGHPEARGSYQPDMCQLPENYESGAVRA